MLAATAVLLALLIVSIVAYESGTPKPNMANSSSEAQDVAWQIGLKNFATSLAAADGKVFVSDNYADVQCYNAQDGKSVWTQNLLYGDYGGGPQVSVYEGKVYASTGYELVERLNEQTGVLEMKYQGPQTDTDDYKMITDFYLADGKIFTGQPPGLSAVFSASTGQQLWAYSYSGLTSNTSSNSIPQSTYVLVTAYDGRVERLNVNTGSVIWTYLGASSEPIVSGNQVILWNYAANSTYPQSTFAIVCLDADTGLQLWSVNEDAQMFQPTVYDGLLLFGSQDGYFYALNMADGSLKWKTNIDALGIIKDFIQNYPSINLQEENQASLTASPPIVDSEGQKVYWSVFSGSYPIDPSKPSNDAAAIMSLDMNTGKILWYTPLESSLIYRVSGQPMALLNNELFVAGDNGVICLNAGDGGVSWERAFYHYVENPVVSGGMVFVAADLYLIAYK